MWKPIKDYEGLYEVSSDGTVRSLDRKDSIGRNRKGRVRRTFLVGDGYEQVILSKGGIDKGFYVHRLVASAFCQNGLKKPEVNHIDCDKTNNCAENLEWVTSQENQQHWRAVRNAA